MGGSSKVANGIIMLAAPMYFDERALDMDTQLNTLGAQMGQMRLAALRQKLRLGHVEVCWPDGTTRSKLRPL
jgi:hypothetical protein